MAPVDASIKRANIVAEAMYKNKKIDEETIILEGDDVETAKSEISEEIKEEKTEEREVYVDELADFAECGLCGTAAVISPVGKIVDHGKEILLPSGMEEMGPMTKKLYETLTGIQMGKIEGPQGWVHTIL